MKLIIASNNAHKVHEIKDMLSDRFECILSLREAGIVHETVEDGNSFAENALKKAREIAEISGFATLADDSGLCVSSLDGAPGIYSARFAGEHTGVESDKANNKLLLEKLSDKQDRSAYFACFMALVYPDGREIVAEGYMHGRITDSYRGNHGFGYDPLFIPNGEERTVAEMSDEEKNAISHRYHALKNLLAKI